MYSVTRSLVLLTLTLAGRMATAGTLNADPPGRIGRVSYLTGSVSLRPGGVDAWMPATLSYPLTSGDEVWSDKDARAEVHIGGSAVWLGPATLMDVQLLGDYQTQLRLKQGSLYVRVPRLGSSETYEIDTPTGALFLLQDGIYRIEIAADGRQSTITVRQGQAQVSTSHGTMEVGTGQSLVIAEGNAPFAAPTVAVAADGWELWAQSRYQVEDQSPTLRYVSPDLVGFDALDDYGTWETDATYGTVWVPDVTTDWAPYRFGFWSWVDPWGWTWIDDAPWGFAPSHYGRWTFLRNRWAWAPGAIVEQPVYAPALVGFLGGSGLDLSVSLASGGTVAWFPLAPGEAYIPPFRVSQEYVREINRSSVKITNVDYSRMDPARMSYRYRSVPNAVTAVSKETFVSGAPVSRAVLRVPAGGLTRASVIGTTAPISPDRQHLLPVSMSRSMLRPPAAALERQVVTRRNAPPAGTSGAEPPKPRSAIAPVRGGSVPRTQLEGTASSKTRSSGNNWWRARPQNARTWSGGSKAN
jgi:hypothetical protein